MISSLFKITYAAGIASAYGAEILIHIGIESIKLSDPHFTPEIKVDDEIRVGNVLAEFILQVIIAAGYSMTKAVIITSTENYIDVPPMTKSTVQEKAPLFYLPCLSN
ncbi:PTS glucose transporter subunit IIA [Klebsiella variicola]|uniref:PTS glucose transporter subunit IIA n=1 Tax=Klebsiella variicola TaxID=244366 RepID=UPI0015D4E2C6